MLAQSIVSIQPMSQPVASIFHQSFEYPVDTPAEIRILLKHIALQIKKKLKIKYEIKKTNNELIIRHRGRKIRIKIKGSEIMVQKPVAKSLYDYTTESTEYLEDMKSINKVIAKSLGLLNPKA